MSGTVTAIARRSFPALSAATVYDAWTNPALLRGWMSLHLRHRDAAAEISRIEMDVRVGGRYLFADTREGSEAWGYYRVLDRPGLVVFTWFVSAEEEAEDNSVVSVEIVTQGAGCAVTIRHEMSDEWADYVDQTANAWASMLDAINETYGQPN